MKKFKIPPLTDIRWGAIGFQTSLLVASINMNYLPHSLAIVLSTLGMAIFLDCLLIRWKWGHWELPLGALSAAYGCLFFVRSYNLSHFLMAVGIAIFSKYILRFNGRHIFNPSNFAIVALLVFFASDIASFGSRWGTDPLFLFIILFFGVPVLWRAKKLVLTFSMFFFFVLIASLRAWYFGSSIVMTASIAFSTGFVISFFFMITDPVTSPVTRKGQALFAATIALIDQTMRQFQYPDATQYAIFITTALCPLAKLGAAAWKREELLPYTHWSLNK
jgi:Na+-transporting NADH:ubiquinone oxidoreductase subunit NqrB